MDTEVYLRMLVLKAPVLIMALSIHEFWHAYTAHLCGDDTGKDQGRVSLNPLVHLDPMGTLMLFSPGSFIGWARPVPFNVANLEHPKRDQILIAVAGPLSNLALGVIFALIIRGLAFAALVPLPYTFEVSGTDAKGRPTVQVRDISNGDQKLVAVGDMLPDGEMLAEVADRDGTSALVLKSWGMSGGRQTYELPQRSETVQQLLVTVWKLLAFATLINFGLLLFNLLPIYPLDGHHVVRELLPPRRSAAYMDWMVQYGPLLLIALLILPLPGGFNLSANVFRPMIFHLTRFFAGDDQLFWVLRSMAL